MEILLILALLGFGADKALDKYQEGLKDPSNFKCAEYTKDTQKFVVVDCETLFKGK